MIRLWCDHFSVADRAGLSMLLPMRLSQYSKRAGLWGTLMIGLMVSTALGQTPAGWKLVWQDEFDGAVLDPSKWEFEVNADGGGNHELQYYVTNNAVVAGGNLTITARHEHYSGPSGVREYTSSRIRTRRKADWRYGRFELRAKLPWGTGLWPAFWMLPTDNSYGGWPHSGEIDIVEWVGKTPFTAYGTLHWAGPDGQHTQSGGKLELPAVGHPFSSAFHVFALEWEPTEMRWSVDGVQYHSVARWPSDAGAAPRPFDQRFHLLLNLAVGGDWPGSPDSSTVFPREFIIDYVRVYQRPIPAPTVQRAGDQLQIDWPAGYALEQGSLGASGWTRLSGVSPIQFNPSPDQAFFRVVDPLSDP